jgi:hypothetical protein
MTDRSRAVRYEQPQHLACCLLSYSEWVGIREPSAGEIKQNDLDFAASVTWSTVTGAVVSALLLASSESAMSELSRLRHRDNASPGASPTAPSRGSRERKIQAAPLAP